MAYEVPRQDMGDAVLRTQLGLRDGRAFLAGQQDVVSSSELRQKSGQHAYWYACEALSAVTAAAAAMPSLACCTKLLSSAGVVTRLPAAHHELMPDQKAWCADQNSSHLASLPSICWRGVYACSRFA